ncbi:hydroxyneurosporene synthase [Fusarium beomiforme]|uniref:Hydroxyneurosporene synthase n=1 Tax=Fusarium beomiforme TaxID=44412 RepID=A0A9P5AEH9_9HYPO|nr:hydroxyneurosporene synthase [Fusarium beomiforme]
MWRNLLLLMAATGLTALPAWEVPSHFKPETGGLEAYTGTLPLPYSLNTSQTARIGAVGVESWWANSFIHGSNGHDYFILAQVMDQLPGSSPTSYRGSILDITDTSQYTQFGFLSNVSTVFPEHGIFNASFPNFGFGVTSETDPLAPMRFWSAVPGATFDITFELSAPVLLNGGLGDFTADNSDLVREWSMPAGKTTGSLSIGGKKVSIDSDKSFTWYDRQWDGAPSSWTWFELHVLQESQPAFTPMSVWVYSFRGNITGSFATVRSQHGTQQVVPVTKFEPSSRVYKSTATNTTYPLDWTLGLADGSEIFLSSVRGDQEIITTDSSIFGYEGYIKGHGTLQGKIGAQVFGLVEMNPLENAF